MASLLHLLRPGIGGILPEVIDLAVGVIEANAFR